MTIELYTKTLCLYCSKAKQYLTAHKLPYTELLFDDDSQRQVMYDELGLVGNQRTVPQIFVSKDGVRTRIGGYSDLLHSGLGVVLNEDF